MKKKTENPAVAAAAGISEYAAGVVSVLRGNLAPLMMKDKLEDFHEKDISEALSALSFQERKKLYRLLDPDMLAGILEYQDEKEAGIYLNEIDLTKVPSVLEAMETDDAVSVLRELTREKRDLIMDMLSSAARENIFRTASYDDSEIGSLMTSNYISINRNCSIKQAMSSLISQAEKNDNISTLFVVDENNVFCGALDLKDLIIARQDAQLSSIIMTSFPYVYGQEELDDCLNKLKDYSESSIPVLDNLNRIVGVITAQNVIEATDDAMGEDYAKLAGLTAEEDLKEPVRESVKKRLPWLIILLALGLMVSSLVGVFEPVIAQLTIVMAFQSLILDMAGNVGTQSLAVTIRVLTSEGLSFRKKLGLLIKEIKVGLLNGSILCILSVVCVGAFIYFFRAESISHAFMISGCIGLSLLLAMLSASAVGTLIPMFFKKIGVDPAVASGPLITTVNDLVAVLCYYGLSWIFLINIFHLGS